MRIPDELIALASERRVIPFVGAGFSVALGLPDWETMLRQVANDMEDIPDFDDILQFTHGDLLQTAEYLYLKSNKHIGPIRHFLERGLAAPADPTLSGPHVELVNLNAPQIYTTNYDDIIERTYKALGLPVSPVVLPRDVALSDNKKTQVVKYHGDLRHEETLVLTESSYYRRLDFESPMDLKFRSDLLGRSVLFMGYSFRDINIRVIWFKLLEMMKDVPEADRTPSYIVRTQPNPVLEELYRAVGLKTIVLSDEDRMLNTDDVSALHGDFLRRLAIASRSGTAAKPWISSARLDKLDDALAGHVKDFQRYSGLVMRMGSAFGLGGDIPNPERIPPALIARASDLYRRLLVGNVIPAERWKLALLVEKRFGPSPEVTHFFATLIASGGQPKVRAEVLEAELPWEQIWSELVPAATVGQIERRLADEVAYCVSEAVDEDIVYAVDIAKRILSGQIFDLTSDPEAVDRLAFQLAQAANLFPEVIAYEPTAGGKPEPTELLKAIRSSPNFQKRGAGSARVARRRAPSAEARRASALT